MNRENKPEPTKAPARSPGVRIKVKFGGKGTYTPPAEKQGDSKNGE